MVNIGHSEAADFLPFLLDDDLASFLPHVVPGCVEVEGLGFRIWSDQTTDVFTRFGPRDPDFRQGCKRAIFNPVNSLGFIWLILQGEKQLGRALVGVS